MRLVASSLRAYWGSLGECLFLQFYIGVQIYLDSIQRFVTQPKRNDSAVNACLNQIAAEKARPELRFADLEEEQQEVIENLAAAVGELHPGASLAAREIAEKLLALLDPRDRLLLTLLHLEGRSTREVEQITGWNGIVIRVRAFRARKKLKAHLQKLMKEGEQ